MISADLSGILHGTLLSFDIESLIRYGGLLIVCLLVFGSTGLFFCFFLPSGAVLFTAGIFTATGILPQGVVAVCITLILASIAGSMTGYGFGYRAGRYLYAKADTRFFRRKYLIAAENFYKKYGALALTAGFFLPVIRTFAPVVAGMIRLSFRRFITYTITGSIVWILAFVLAGFFIGAQPFLKPWLNYIVIGFIAVVTVPLLVRIIREMKKPGKET